MTTLADIRTRVRKDLRDTDASAYRWPEAQLDRHIENALDEFSLAIPMEQTGTIATTPGSRDISVASLAGLIEVEAVEHPAGQFPPAYTDFSRWGNTVTLHLALAPSGANAKVYYAARHTLDGAGSTIPAFYEDIVVMGAGALAAIELAAYTIDQLNAGGAGVPDQLASWGRARLTAFRQLLHQHSRRNRVRPRRLYTPA